MKKIFLFTIFIIAIFAKPITLENVMADKGEWRLDLGVTNIVSNSLLSQTVSLQYKSTLRYGLTKELELSLSASGLSNWSRTFVSGEDESYDGAFESVDFALSYEIFKETDYPAIIVGLGTSLYENLNVGTDSNEDKVYANRYFRTASLSVISYYSVDPVVFLINMGYQYRGKYEYDGDTYKPSDTFYISPNVYFTPNPYTSINVGVRYSNNQRTYKNDNTTTGKYAFLTYLLGVTYEINPYNSIYTSVSTGSYLGSTQDTLSIQYSLSF